MSDRILNTSLTGATGWSQIGQYHIRYTFSNPAPLCLSNIYTLNFSRAWTFLKMTKYKLYKAEENSVLLASQSYHFLLISRVQVLQWEYKTILAHVNCQVISFYIYINIYIYIERESRWLSFHLIKGGKCSMPAVFQSNNNNKTKNNEILLF